MKHIATIGPGYVVTSVAPIKIVMQLSGNQEQDEAHYRDAMRTQSRLDRGLCPNDGVTALQERETHKECPVCGFTWFVKHLTV